MPVLLRARQLSVLRAVPSLNTKANTFAVLPDTATIGDSRSPGVLSAASFALLVTAPVWASTRCSLPPMPGPPLWLPTYTSPANATGEDSFVPGSTVAGKPPPTTSCGLPWNTPVNLCRRPLPSPTQSTSAA